MNRLADFPVIILAVAFLLQFIAAFAGDALRRRNASIDAPESLEFKTILPASLTLLALIVGFAFSMAVGRYDQRKNYEEEEVNAFGTEYVRVDILPAAQAAHIRELLKQYTDLRIRFYVLRDPVKLERNAVQTSELQSTLWHAVVGPVATQPTAPMALVVSGMNDVLNAQGYTQAAFRNRVPRGAWLLMAFVAMACNFLFGYTEKRVGRAGLLVLPLILAVPFYLVADIDSPRGGLIRVAPQNLISFAHSLSEPAKKAAAF
ncbi:MAG TPA: hypothetical protein VL356_02935 [Acidocella sp.]|jgi:hypothetical protein|nr:hypothetical protein [Acidocella sp.]